MALITNTDPLLSDLGYADLSAADQAIVDALITSTQTLLEDYLNRKLELATFTDEKLDGTGQNLLIVKNPPIRTLTNVKVRISRSDVTTYTTNYFEFTANTGEIEFSEYNMTSSETEMLLSRFPRGRKNIMVTYDGGFSHYDIKVAAAEIIRNEFRGDLEGAPIFEKIGDYAYKKQTDTSGDRHGPRADEFLKSIYRRINMYRLRKA